MAVVDALAQIRAHLVGEERSECRDDRNKSGIDEILDHVQQGVYRPGAWERHWLVQAIGDDWLVQVERDPDAPYFDRPRATDGG